MLMQNGNKVAESWKDRIVAYIPRDSKNIRIPPELALMDMWGFKILFSSGKTFCTGSIVERKGCSQRQYNCIMADGSGAELLGQADLCAKMRLSSGTHVTQYMILDNLGMSVRQLIDCVGKLLHSEAKAAGSAATHEAA